MEYVIRPLTPNLRRVRHSRMFLAGIQAEFGLDPRLKHSGVTVLKVASLFPSRNFETIHFGAGFVLSMVRYSAACNGLPHAS
jgi:hypothetical protein